jgi:hypothetical protein
VEDEQQRQRWEYLAVRLPHDRQRSETIAGVQAFRVPQDEAILNALGDEGWEAVAATWPGEGAVLQVLLKRPRA